MKVKTIDINCLSWFDRINGNSYFAATVIVNYQMKTEQRFILPFQYGYGDHYKSEAAKLLDEKRVIKLGSYSNGSKKSLWQYCDENKIILRASKVENCKKSDLKNIS